MRERHGFTPRTGLGVLALLILLVGSACSGTDDSGSTPDEDSSQSAVGSEDEDGGGTSSGGGPSDSSSPLPPGGGSRGCEGEGCVAEGGCVITASVHAVNDPDGAWVGIEGLPYDEVVDWTVQTDPAYEGLSGEVELKPQIYNRFTTDATGRATGRIVVYPDGPSYIDLVVQFDNVEGESDYQGCAAGYDRLVGGTPAE